MLELLRELSSERGLAMIIVTHNLGVVADICDTVSVMRAGRIVEQQRRGHTLRRSRPTPTPETCWSPRARSSSWRSQMTEKLLQISDLVVRYGGKRGGKTVIENVSLDSGGRRDGEPRR